MPTSQPTVDRGSLDSSRVILGAKFTQLTVISSSWRNPCLFTDLGSSDPCPFLKLFEHQDQMPSTVQDVADACG